MDKNKSIMLYMDHDNNESSGQALAMRMRNSSGPRTASSPQNHFETENIYGNPSRPNYGIEIEDLEPTSPTVKYNNNNKNEDDEDEKSFENGLINSSRPLSPRLPSSNAGNFPHQILPSPAPPTFDVNVYQQKKTLAQGMMDLALLSANANQLRYVLSSRGHPFFFASLIMISLSLALQIGVGIGLIWNSRYDVKEVDEVHQANRANNWTVVGIFLVTILNVFISSFGVIDQQPDVIVGLPYRSINSSIAANYTSDEDDISLRFFNSTLTNETNIL